MGKLEMTVDEFIELNYIQKLPITKIAELKGVADPTIHYWKNKHEKEINVRLIPKQADTAEIKQKECTCKGKENNAKYEQEISDLKKELTSRQNECNLWYEESKKHESNYNHLDNLYKQQTEVVCRLKESKNDLQWEFDQIKKKQYQDSYVIEGQKKRIEDLGKTLKLYESENKALRELVRLWV